MKDWKTTIAGLSAAALNLYANGMGGKQIALSVAVALLGKLASDGNQKQTPEAK